MKIFIIVKKGFSNITQGETIYEEIEEVYATEDAVKQKLVSMGGNALTNGWDYIERYVR